MNQTQPQTTQTISNVHSHICKHANNQISLLKQKEVIQWLFGDLSFLPPIQSKNKTQDTKQLKILEDEWGRRIMKDRRPDLKLDKQWTNKFGEHLCEELCILLGKTVTKPIKQNHYQPDTEVDDAIWEAKAETFFTEGTASEKILGCPFKYADVPILYKKPLKILCMGGAEKGCREQYGNLPGPKCTPQKQAFLTFYKEHQITYVAATELLKSLAGV